MSDAVAVAMISMLSTSYGAADSAAGTETVRPLNSGPAATGASSGGERDGSLIRVQSSAASTLRLDALYQAVLA